MLALAGSPEVSAAAMPLLLDEAGLQHAFAHVKLDILEQAQSTAQLFASAQADLVATVSAVHLATLLAVMECQPPPQQTNTQVCAQLRVA
jgi:hypothetical protein